MQKLSLNKAAKEAGVAKSTLLEALKSGRMSAARSGNGQWQIDPAELFRVFSKTGSTERIEPIPTPLTLDKKTTNISALEVEVKMLREQIERLDAERVREREQLSDQIESLKAQAERQSADHRQALAALTDQRDSGSEKPKRGLWARLWG